MGEVYAAYDHELDRKVAVKLLRVKPGNGVSLAEGRQRTMREAQAIARLSHPNVVVVYDVGAFEDQVFIAMEFVDGNTVTYWLQARERTWEEILKVFLSAGRGLTAAHEKDLVHRDFKPDNVMVGRDGQVRVMDFGLARHVSEKGERGEKGARATPRTASEAAKKISGEQAMSTLVINNDTMRGSDTQEIETHSGAFDNQLTRTGAMMGTPAYMSPEQFLGSDTDARTDQFSFCVALYEALYGERPFGGNSMFALTTNVVQGNVKEPPPGSKVPLWVRRVLLRGLRPNANERYPTMQALLAALEKDPAVAFRRRALTVGALLLPVLVSLGVRQSLAQRPEVCVGGDERLAGVWELGAAEGGESPRQAAIHRAFLATNKVYAQDVFASVRRVLSEYARKWAGMYREACEATNVRGEQSAEVLDLRMSCLQERLGGLRALTQVFSEATGEVVENAVSAANALGTLERCADVPLLRSVVRPPEERATRARVDDLRRRLDDLKARIDAGRWTDGVQNAMALADEARAIGYQPLVAEVLSVLGTLHLWRTEAVEGERALEEAVWRADAARHDEVRADAAINLLWAYGYLQNRYPEAERWSKTAESVLRRLGGRELQEAWLLNNQGGLYEQQGRHEEALRAHEEALRLKVRARGADHPDVGISEGNISIVLQGLARSQEALVHVDRAIEILSRGLGAEHPEVATQLSNRGEILNALGRAREARLSFERARVIWERELGLDARNLAYALTGIGLSYLAERDAVSAIAPLEKARKIRDEKETDASKKAETSFALARALWESGRDRARADALAQSARAGYAHEAAKVELASVDAWLASRSR
jgi:serine/threonine protein kinase/tetratricopeptide (TPR) repeat protein